MSPKCSTHGKWKALDPDWNLLPSHQCLCGYCKNGYIWNHHSGILNIGILLKSVPYGPKLYAPSRAKE